ncbi:MAG: hypothetical protein V8Q84_10625, partial [Bilophila sp.]
MVSSLAQGKRRSILLPSHSYLKRYRYQAFMERSVIINRLIQYQKKMSEKGISVLVKTLGDFK